MRFQSLRFQLLLAGLLASTAAASTTNGARAGVLDRVRADGVVRCGGVIRPGLAFPAVDHTWHGIEFDICRAVASAVLGDADKIEFHAYYVEHDFDRVRAGTDAVSFLTGSELFAHELIPAVLPGPAVFYESTRVMVPDDGAPRHVAQLANTTICAEPGTGAERSLQLYMSENAIPFHYSSWQELEEMMDAFVAGRCPSVAGEETALAALRLGAAESGRAGRILPEPLSVAPVIATSTVTDPEWALIVGWTIRTLIAAERPDPHGETRTLPVGGTKLGLDADWQKRVVAAVGSYADIFRRSAGEDSVLDLPRGINARWDAGGLMTAPTVE